MALVQRTTNADDCWKDACQLLQDTAHRHGLIYAEQLPKIFGHPALCSIITTRKRLTLMLQENELRITYKALPSFENLVCNIHDVPMGHIAKLCERFP